MPLIAIFLILVGYSRWGPPFAVIVGLIAYGIFVSGRYYQGWAHARSIRRNHFNLIRGNRR